MWSDTDLDGTVDTLVYEPTTFDVVNTYAVIVVQAQGVKDEKTRYAFPMRNGVVTKISDTGAHGYSRSVTTLKYSCHGLGQMTRATGRTVGDQNSEVWSDTDRDGTVDTLVDQPTTFDVMGRAAGRVREEQEVKSVTTRYTATQTKGVFTQIRHTGATG